MTANDKPLKGTNCMPSQRMACHSVTNGFSMACHLQSYHKIQRLCEITANDKPLKETNCMPFVTNGIPFVTNGMPFVTEGHAVRHEWHAVRDEWHDAFTCDMMHSLE